LASLRTWEDPQSITRFTRGAAHEAARKVMPAMTTIVAGHLYGAFEGRWRRYLHVYGSAPRFGDELFTGSQLGRLGRDQQVERLLERWGRSQRDLDRSRERFGYQARTIATIGRPRRTTKPARNTHEPNTRLPEFSASDTSLSISPATAHEALVKILAVGSPRLGQATGI
jgi:hypothetical protein